MTGTREQITKATTEGKAAAEAGEQPTACPYPRTSILRGAWVRGFARARPITVSTERDE